MRKLSWLVMTLLAISTGGASAALISRADAAATDPRSIYLADLDFKDDGGAPVKLSNWKGRTVVITMAYTTCTHTCPLVMQKLKKVEAALKARSIDPEIVVATFDPARDKPETLQAYRTRSEITSDRWHFLSGSDPATRRLSMLLGIKYRRNPETGDIMHDNKILVLNGEGVPVDVLSGLDADITHLSTTTGEKAR